MQLTDKSSIPPNEAAQSPQDLFDSWMAAVARAETAEQAAEDFRVAAETWVIRTQEESQAAQRAERAFRFASCIAFVLAIVAWIGWLR